MKKIGTTSSGTVIVEMTVAQFEGLSQLQAPSTLQPASEPMSAAEKVTFVRDRISKVGPKKKEGVQRSIAAMFQFTGGITSTEIEAIVARLQKEKFLAIDERDRVTYKKG